MTQPPREPACIFCRIAGGDVPCHKLYEDEQVLAFLDLGPLAPGHTLIIPRGHWETIDRVPAETAAACFRIVPALSRAVIAATGAPGWNLLQNNGTIAHQAVGHVHLHLIPRPDGERGLGLQWPAGTLEEAEAKTLAGRITGALELP